MLDTDGALLCGLQLGESIVVRGLCDVRVVRGCVTVAGARLSAHAAPFLLRVPDVHPAAPIVAVDGAPADGPLAAHPVVVRLENAPCGLEQLGRVCPLAGMDPFAMERWRSAYTFVLERERDCLHVPRAWADQLAALEAAAAPLAVVVRGAKNTGKSTFAQLALHTLLTASERGQVAFLELDPGQPTFGPPGLLALHVLDATHERGVWAPSWCTARTPVRAHHLGDVTPRDDPARYMAAARDLIAYFREELQHGVIGADGRAALRRAAPMPLVVNTHGWVKGLGLDLLGHACAVLAPTHVVDLGAPLPPLAAHSCVLPALGDADVPSSAARRLNAAEARVLSLLAYLHMTQLPQPGTGVRAAWDFTRALVARAPYMVDVQTGLAAGCAVLDTRAAVDEALQLLALNGRIAAIVRAPAREAASPDVWRAAFERGAALVHAPAGVREPALCPALGLALVRSIDRAQGAVHLLTPLTGPQLQEAIETGDALGLVQGALDLPFWGALDAEAYADVVHMWRAPAAELAGVPRAEVPYLAWPRDMLGDAPHSPAEPVGARPRKVRRNLMRRGQQAT
ncbi:Polynucleotide 5'-hydroxyl-kinase grc3 [Malassezia caprae]|uniref:Polynucleotide 5'-hydroxyl-kinase GRC3 n=1 Tax=Malassezia caprae TaxID=1381934 RepID=A0AAF0IVX6_9BASI|nr:Polynucleotide 5'-hydroxyl-kinase grc3 [Malassezia caprae]